MKRDRFGRHHHTALYRNTYSTMHGILLDTLEIIFFDPITDIPSRENIIQISQQFLKREPLWIAWPHDTLLTIGIPAGYYKIDSLQSKFSHQGYKVDTIQAFYSARVE